jgi:hypothetical protein
VGWAEDEIGREWNWPVIDGEMLRTGHDARRLGLPEQLQNNEQYRIPAPGA